MDFVPLILIKTRMPSSHVPETGSVREKNVVSFSVVRYGTGRQATGHCEKKHNTCHRSNISTKSNSVIQVETVVKHIVYFT